MSTEANKAIVREWVRAFNSGDPHVLAAMPASRSGGLYSAPGADRERSVLELARAFRRAAPDLWLSYQDIVAEEDAVMLRFTLQGTHCALLFGIPATSRPFKILGMALFRIAAGKIAECSVLVDHPSLLQQLGAAPTHASPLYQDTASLPASG